MSSARQLMNRLYYFTIEDESILAEAFAKFERDFYAIAYKVNGTEDVFVTTQETKEAMDRHDVPYTLLAEEETSRIGVFHSISSKEELGDYDDSLKALALAYRSVAIACVGRNGDKDLGFDLSASAKKYTYFTAPAGHTYIWRLFETRDEALEFVDKLTVGEKDAVDWAESIPLETAAQLKAFN
jgi:hypothetical protein